jgi:hypothetical protein
MNRNNQRNTKRAVIAFVALLAAAIAVPFTISSVRSASAQDIPGSGLNSDPVEPAPGSAVAVRIKSPSSQMHFTAGLPFRLLADAWGVDEWTCPPGHPPYACSDNLVQFYIDGAKAGEVHANPEGQNHWELRLPSGIAQVGDHMLTTRYIPHDPKTAKGGDAIEGTVPVTIHVDPRPTRNRTITLTQDLVLSGASPLDWSDAVIIGNGHRVTAEPGYEGSISLINTFVTGLGNYNSTGIEVTTSGAVVLDNTIFEATAPMRFVINESADVTIRQCEFRASNFVTYVANNPDATPILQFAGNTTGSKTFSGNNVARGMRGYKQCQGGGSAA